MNDKVVDIGSKQKEEKQLYVCLICKHRWNGSPPCPNCKSYSCVKDELHILPETHGLYACRCKNAHFKIGNHPRKGTYFKCVLCGMNHWPEDLGLGDKH